MIPLAVNKRKFHTFLSHAHVDKAIVDPLYLWLSEVAGVPVWYDAAHLPPAASIVSALPDAMTNCRGMIIVVSQASLRSGWVEQEYRVAMAQLVKCKDFRIVPIRLDASAVPDLLETTKWIDLPEGRIDLRAADNLLAGIYGEDSSLKPSDSKDVYISRTWRESESQLADHVCRHLNGRGFRLIGDSKDQAGFEEGLRIKSIISSCGALVAILPDRGEGRTSEYMLKEIRLAQDLGLPFLVVAEPTVKLAETLELCTIRLSAGAIPQDGNPGADLERGIDRIEEEWERPQSPHYVFFATIFGDEHAERNRVLRQVIERVTAMPCVLGDDIREGQIQGVIIDKISNAFVVIADISEENLNTCIEAGVAVGARRRLHLVAAGPRRRPPFMFRDQQTWYYANEAGMIGRIHQIAYPYRRRVLNAEVCSKQRPLSFTN
jgi:hypothetical protein